MNTAILLAAGNGRRMQRAVSDKILAHLRDDTVFGHSIRAFVASGIIDSLTVVYRDQLQCEELISALVRIDLRGIPVHWVQGGSERQDSVLHALEAQAHDCQYVYIHDCARPLLSVASIHALREAVERDQAAALAHPVTDTIKRIPRQDRLRQTKLEDLDRSRLWAMETPQAFKFSEIVKAYRHISDEGICVTDDTAAAALIGLRTTLVPNTKPNPKITTPADLAYVHWLLQNKALNRPT